MEEKKSFEQIQKVVISDLEGYASYCYMRKCQLTKELDFYREQERQVDLFLKKVRKIIKEAAL